MYRRILPFSYTIVGNHYDLDLDLDPDNYGHSSVPTQNNPIIIRLSDITHKANEQWHIVCDQTGHLHIGLVIEVFDIYGDVILSTDIFVSATAFYRFPMRVAKQYLIDLSDEWDSPSFVFASDIAHNIRVDGLRDIPDGIGTGDGGDNDGCGGFTIKTYWIRIIQRRWKRVYSEKMRKLRLRGGLRAQRHFEICGKYGVESARGLRGLFVERQQI